MSGRRTFGPELEVSGGNILSVLHAMGSFRPVGEEILASQGLTGVTSRGWYPLEHFVGALNLIGRRVGPHTLFQIGRQIPSHIEVPPGINTFEKVCAAFGAAFDLNHRGGNAGTIGYRTTSRHSAVIVTGTPYPCDFDRGVIQGFFHRFLGSRVSVAHDPDRPCKAAGGETCTYLVRL